MKEIKKVVVTLLIALLIIGVSSIALATDDGNVTIIEDEAANNSTGNINRAANNTNRNNILNTNTNTNRNTTNTNSSNSSKYNNTDLPKAGSTDSMTIVFVIAIFGISALYAYKKIKDYNLK